MEKIDKSDEKWRKTLTPEQYKVLRQKGTEAPFSGIFYLNHETGYYCCAGCGNVLFDSASKFDSGCGWPSFSLPKDSGNVEEVEDNSHGMHRVEVICAKCGGHLGHVFNDGPKPTGLRYCINSISLQFIKGG
ncbi:MAG: peptide-methionine (R)-S-oxide reductase MsrB [Spirochaetia bacterium]|nr:peptide-methionine (R)-S-oxide reductase MsrB [Spirochaetia bacterium]